MYIPTAYKNTNIEEVELFLKEHQFGILINQVEGKPWGTHIPMVLEKSAEGKSVLVGHIAKANPQAKTLNEGATFLAIFNGPHAYVSSSWYKEEEVPTWNYIAVHVYGTMRILNTEERMDSLHRLVNLNEKTVKCPINLNSFSEATLQQANGVVGFELSVDTIEAAYKLSQTREEDHSNIISELVAGDQKAKEIAAKMKK